jgi:propanol-preferring alcohol dehydrogenase
MEWPEGMLPWKLPFTLGHENAGWVHALGAGVEGLRTGEPVLVYGPWGCSRCAPCRLGQENYCDAAASLPAAGGGLGRDGGMAEYMRVPSSRLLVPLGDLDPVAAAPLTDAALTPYHAIKRSLGLLSPGSTALVFGVGGLGQMAVQLLRLLCAIRIVAVDLRADNLERARTLGADHALDASDDVAARVRELTGGRGADLVLDMVGAEATLAQGAEALRPQGRLVIVGLAMGTLPVNFFAIPYGAQVATSYWGTVTELMELVELARGGRLALQVERYPLTRAAAAYDDLRAGKVKGRAVVVPD